MTIKLRRTFLRLCGACAAAAALASSAYAQAWPARQPIRFVVPYPPGGASDITARVLAQKLTDALGQAVVVENRPGANGIIALELVAKAPPDGYTLLMGNLGPNAINPAVYAKLPYDALKGFTPITLTSVVPLVVLVAPSAPYQSLPELLAYAKAHPGKLTFASAGNGSSNHMAGEMLKTMAQVAMVHVPYKGDAPGLQDVIAGTVNLAMPTVIGGIASVNAGLLKPLAVTGSKRSAALPEVPTIAESGVPGFEASSWGGVMGPAGMPRPVVERLHREIARILQLPEVSSKLASLGAEIVGSGPDEFGRFLDDEVKKWTSVAKANRIRLD
ncbi:tripartite tricarboxylate transporter substrate binding protein [Comamonas humi]